MPNATAIPVRLGDRTYEVAIGRGLLEQASARIVDALGHMPKRVLIVADTGALPHVERVVHSFEAAQVEVHRVDLTPLERSKSLDTFGVVLGACAGAGLERSDPIIAVGGGIVGDIAGFAASAYRRGVPSILCPTTLLSMVDASVGGKTGVNLLDPEGRLLKNMAGTFHQPSLVLADLDSLSTLSERHRRSGLAECVKHAMLSADHADPGALDWISTNRQNIADLEPETIETLVTRSVRLKASVVECDEREMASAATITGRATLNLGHTFAHAMETIENLSPTNQPSQAPLQHGEAVALGLIAACATAEAAGLCKSSYSESISELLGSLGLPTTIANLPDDNELRTRMQADKKVTNGRLRLVLPIAIGSVRLVDDCPPEAITAGWQAIRA